MYLNRKISKKHLPQFIYDSFKQSTINKSKTSPLLPPPQPSIESEEISLAASIIDKAKRTIENVDEKKLK
ncbi:unnamed protein product [Rotaria sordida]|uniref:Uncharacterized protein n=1 Tax=Rotaria sordida TaxID=392033 RepID=A0A814FIC3_9BILA|nr:unnamed protein product [Rotaria sordida]CAF0980450.1 unnamed protein product [Rotaria sordida]